MDQNRYLATDDDRESVVGHVSYEIEQMRLARELIESGEWEDGPASWLLAEAGLVHARNVIDFLFYQSRVIADDRLAAGERPTARAEWFLSETQWNPHARRGQFEEQLGVNVKEIARRLNRRVFHLALDRDDVPRVHFLELVVHLETSLTGFLYRLPESWKDRFPAQRASA